MLHIIGKHFGGSWSAEAPCAHVGNNSNDRHEPRLAIEAEEANSLSNWVAVWKELLQERLIDHGRLVLGSIIGLLKRAAFQNGNSKRFKILARD